MKCVCCDYEMQVKACGVDVVELAGNRPYKLYSADVLACRVCGREILYGFGQPSYSEAKLAEAAAAKGARVVRDHTRRG